MFNFDLWGVHDRVVDLLPFEEKFLTLESPLEKLPHDGNASSKLRAVIENSLMWRPCPVKSCMLSPRVHDLRLKISIVRFVLYALKQELANHEMKLNVLENAQATVEQDMEELND